MESTHGIHTLISKHNIYPNLYIHTDEVTMSTYKYKFSRQHSIQMN